MAFAAQGQDHDADNQIRTSSFKMADGTSNKINLTEIVTKQYLDEYTQDELEHSLVTEAITDELAYVSLNCGSRRLK